VVADLICNHASADSHQFRDVVARGSRSPFAGMFLTLDRVFPAGATEAQLLAIFRPRPGLPFTIVTRPDGTRLLAWTTFTPQQIDLDVHDPAARAYLLRVLDTFAEHRVAMVRLDAVGYAVKTPGTSCFMTPETFAFIDWLTSEARGRGVDVLVEVHSHYRKQVEIAALVDRVYDFALPPLVLHALFNRTAAPLKQWLAIRPVNAVTVLDTHDGIGVVDVGIGTDGAAGLVPQEELVDLVEQIHWNSGNTSRLATGAAASNLDLYQVNCTFYDALARSDRQYLIARAIQLLTPGIPQIYYVGLLAGTNDVELLRRTGVGRDINRHRYTPHEVDEALAQPVVQALCALIRLRNSHPAFDGRCAVLEGSDHELGLRWEDGEHWVQLDVDFADLGETLAYSAPAGAVTLTDLRVLPTLL
jgi:sucrose phosphorylase